MEPRPCGFWVLTNYDDLAWVVKDNETFSSRHDLTADSPYAGIIIPGAPVRSSFIEMDPPEFLEYRQLLNRWFAPASVERLRPVIRDVVTDCLDRRIESGEIDFVLDLAAPVPTVVSLGFVGLPLDMWRSCANANHAIAHTVWGTPEFDDAIALLTAQFAMFRDEIASRRRQPQDDLLTALTRAEVAGRPLTDDDIVEMLGLIVSGGIDTTSSVMGCTMHYLSNDPPARDQLIASPELIPSACEEFLRYFTPNTAMARTVTRDVEIGGQTMHAGDRVLIFWVAANHDPAMFADPEEIVLDRGPNRHMSFGLGAHRCIGANLARAETIIILEEVRARLPDFVIDEALAERYTSLGINNGYVKMPASFTPGPCVGVEHPSLVS